MSYEIAKIILWVLLCIPVALIAFFLTRNVNKLNHGITKKHKDKEKALQMAEQARRSSYMRRRQFDEDYERMRRSRRGGYGFEDYSESEYYNTCDDGGYAE